MARKPKPYIPYNPERLPGETLQQQYRRLAKAADQRLIRIEELVAHNDLYKGAERYAYRTAVHDIATYGPYKGKKAHLPRFNRKMPKTEAGLQRKIADMAKFLLKPTSSQSGINEIYMKRTTKINEDWGTSFNWTDLATFLEHGYYDKFKGKYGSETSWEMIATIQGFKPEDIEAINKAKNATEVGSLLDSVKDRELRDKLAEALKKDDLAEAIQDLYKGK